MRHELLRFLLDCRAEGKRVVGYGAPGKGNTLLNYCGIRTDLLEYTVDRNPYKHGRFTPGTRIPIHRSGAHRTRTGPTSCWYCPGTCEPRLTAQLAYVARVGRRSWSSRFRPCTWPIATRNRRDGDIDEGRAVLRRVRHADAQRRRRRHPQADADGRAAPADLARHALLRALRAQGVHPVPRLRRRPHQELLPELPRDDVERLRACATARSSCCSTRHQRLDDHLRRHRAGIADRRAAAPGAPAPRRRRVLPGQLRRRAHRRPAGRDDRRSSSAPVPPRR